MSNGRNMKKRSRNFGHGSDDIIDESFVATKKSLPVERHAILEKMVLMVEFLEGMVDYESWIHFLRLVPSYFRINISKKITMLMTSACCSNFSRLPNSGPFSGFQSQCNCETSLFHDNVVCRCKLDLSRFPNLRKLMLRRNAYHSVLEGDEVKQIGSLKRLEVLSIVTSCPAMVMNHLPRSLKTFHCFFQSLPKSVDFRLAENLTTLQLAGKLPRYDLLNVLPPNITALRMTDAELDDDLLKKLPSTLQQLYVWSLDCSLSSLPRSLQSLRASFKMVVNDFSNPPANLRFFSTKTVYSLPKTWDENDDSIRDIIIPETVSHLSVDISSKTSIILLPRQLTKLRLRSCASDILAEPRNLECFGNINFLSIFCSKINNPSSVLRPIENMLQLEHLKLRFVSNPTCDNGANSPDPFLPQSLRHLSIMFGKNERMESRRIGNVPLHWLIFPPGMRQLETLDLVCSKKMFGKKCSTISPQLPDRVLSSSCPQTIIFWLPHDVRLNYQNGSEIAKELGRRIFKRYPFMTKIQVDQYQSAKGTFDNILFDESNNLDDIGTEWRG